MQLSEFKERVKSFMTEELVQHYETDYEPAYMEAGSIDKDDFCALLKNKTGKEIVEAFSSYVVQTRQVRNADAIHVSTLEAKVKELREKLLQCTKALKLISSTCDRAFQLVPKWCLEAEK